MSIPYQAVGFPSGHPITNSYAGIVPANWDDLLGAAMTVGRRNWEEVMSAGMYSFYECFYRVLMVKANLDSSGPAFVQTQAYKALDGSEKAAVSYFLGLIATKLVIERLGQLNWVQHFDAYLRSINKPIKGKRPDLIVWTFDEKSLVIESKGRTNGFSAETMQRALEAKGSNIGMGVPDFYVAAITYFSRTAGNSQLHVQLQDPPTADGDALRYDRPAYLYEYYKLLTDLLVKNDSTLLGIGNRRARVVNMDALDVSIGLDDRIFELAQSHDGAAHIDRVLHEVHEVVRLPIEPRGPGPVRTATVLPDGVVVIAGTSWA